MILEEFINRLNKPATNEVIENWERHAGLKAIVTLPVEQRWALMMCGQQFNDLKKNSDRISICQNVFKKY